MHILHHRSGELCPISPKNIYIKYLELFHMGYLSILSIHLFIQSFVSIDIQEYLSYTLAQYYVVYFLAHIVCSWT